MELIPSEVKIHYNIHKDCEITQIGSGFINRTFLISSNQNLEKFILQEVNTKVFLHPEIISNNVEMIKQYLNLYHTNYLFPAPLADKEGNLCFNHEDSSWRLLPFVENAIAYDTLSNPQQAFEAAAQFGKLSKLLKDFPVEKLGYTIPQFHDLKLRLLQYKSALAQADNGLIEQAKEAIKSADYFSSLSTYYESYLKRPDFKNRVIHHDTKISNVLLNPENNQGVCVIDLDTLMPGKFISDLGDMMRTYLCAFSENERDISKINIRIPYFEATVKGYLSEMKEIMTETEKELILFSGKYIIYMQAIRFLTDFLNGSIYYKISYRDQNLDRANNQFALLKDIYREESTLQGIIHKLLK